MERRQAEHLVRRTGFGMDWQLVDRLVALPRAEAVDAVLDFTPNPSFRAPSEVRSEAGIHWDKVRELTRAWFEHMRTVPRPLQEHLVLFWHGHFATHADRVAYGWQVADQLELLRRGCVGGFRDLIQVIAVGPAMLQYLDNYKNEVASPNENFARELLELHTLSPGHYSEQDIVETARAWTGHSLADTRRSYHFSPVDHDHGLKTIFGITRNFDGPEVIDEIVLGVRREACARFIASKLWSYFAYPDPPAHIVDELIVPYMASGLDIGVLVSAVLNHDAFYGETARNGLVRGPVHWAIAASASARVPISDSQPERFVAEMGQQPFRPLTPEGWGNNADWISPVAMWSRADYARRVANKMNLHSFLKEIVDLPVPQAVEALRHALGMTVLGPASRQALHDYLHAERAANQDRPGSNTEFRNIVTLALLSPEMQLA
ncbi:MAG: DUF1800 domain-containing protein [Actinomycetota bacterium]|nr:DUF1800 domain-containing protein [Actinomycetota bacterium]